MSNCSFGSPLARSSTQPEQLIAEVGVQHGHAGSGDGLPQPLLGLPGAELRIGVGQVHRRQAHVRRQPRQPGGVRDELPHGVVPALAPTGGRRPTASSSRRLPSPVSSASSVAVIVLVTEPTSKRPLAGVSPGLTWITVSASSMQATARTVPGAPPLVSKAYGKRPGRVRAPRHAIIIARVSPLRVVLVFKPEREALERKDVNVRPDYSGHCSQPDSVQLSRHPGPDRLACGFRM